MSDVTRLERARSLCSEACYMAALQRRRLQTVEPEDATFITRQWADWQFFIVALRRLRQAAQIADFHPDIKAEIGAFDAALPALQTMRNVGEHIEDYALDRGRNKNLSRTQLQVGVFGAAELNWLGERLVADVALSAAEALLRAVCDADIS